jgi:hypothetical protein
MKGLFEMNAYQIKYKMAVGAAKLSDWMTEEKARTWFEQLRANDNCVWCELIYTPEDESYIVDEFVKG